MFGIGSPHGADRVGWMITERLGKHDQCRAAVHILSTPVQLLDHLDGCDVAIIVDACQTNAPVGTIFRLTWPDSRIADHQSLSSHGIGLCEALKLAEQLGRLPKRVVLYGLEVATNQDHSSDQSIIGIDELERRVLDELSTTDS